MRLYAFEKLDVWKKSKLLSKRVYQLTSKLPNEEKFGLTSQIKRSAISVASNIAEGTSRISGKEQARFSEIAYGSLLELLNQLLIAESLGFISDNDIHEIRPLIEEISNKINALRKAQLNK